MPHPQNPLDAATWVPVELTRHGEMLLRDGTIAAQLRNVLGVEADWPIFVPAELFPPTEEGGAPTVFCATDGYAYIAAGLLDSQYLSLEDTRLVRRVLTSKDPRTGRRVVQTLPDRALDSTRQSLKAAVARSIRPGTRVRITQGVLSNLVADVVAEEGDFVHVWLQLRTLELIRAVSKQHVQPIVGGVGRE